VELDRTTALTYFLRFLAGNPDGDAAARALVLGALAPLGAQQASIYAHDRSSLLELIGIYGNAEHEPTGYRVFSIGMPTPVGEAFMTLNPVVVPVAELADRYPLLNGETVSGAQADPASGGQYVFMPIMNSGVPIGTLAIERSEDGEWSAADWQYVDGVLAAIAMWMNNQREILIDRWRKSAPAAPRELKVTDRQHEIIELIGMDKTNGEIAKALGYSIPTIKKDLQAIMQLLGTHDRRSTAGRARELGLLPERRARD
jgi:DNA-binding CsgD family transcriptional regulator